MRYYEILHAELLSACNDIEDECKRAGMEGFHLTITAHRGKYDDAIELKYQVSAERYSSGPSGNELGPVIDEALRRFGWNVANNTKLIGNT